MFENFNNLNAIGNEGDNFHCGGARGTKQGIYFINLLDEASPGQSARGSVGSIINCRDLINQTPTVIVRSCFFSFASCCIGVITVVADEGFVRIWDMKADAMEEFNDREDFEITFFTFMHRGGIDNGMSFFDVIDFIRGERGVNNILSEIGESLVVVMRDGDIGMNGEAAVAP